MKKRGFTLLELLVVIAIIAILAGILVPAFNRAFGHRSQKGGDDIRVIEPNKVDKGIVAY